MLMNKSRKLFALQIDLLVVACFSFNYFQRHHENPSQRVFVLKENERTNTIGRQSADFDVIIQSPYI